jgi:hypothetical protein
MAETLMRSHAVNIGKRAEIDGTPMAFMLCGAIMDIGELHTSNVGFFARLETASRKTECKDCANAARR